MKYYDDIVAMNFLTDHGSFLGLLYEIKKSLLLYA